ncbi:MAG: prepilin peptidase, partial [Lachnospiraceae bacterium]|nr:prepilin peptidase [Lachnospiraceae bacterium]
MFPFYTTILFYVILFMYGIVVGSFLNVCILRIPLKESLSSKRSHCMSCGHTLAWYDLFPLFSYLFLRGKCRYC